MIMSAGVSCIVGAGLEVAKGDCGQHREQDEQDGETTEQTSAGAALAFVGFEARENRDDGAERWQRWSGHNMRGEGVEFGLHKVKG